MARVEVLAEAVVEWRACVLVGERSEGAAVTWARNVPCPIYSVVDIHVDRWLGVFGTGTGVGSAGVV